MGAVRLVGMWIAGERLEDALRVSRRQNALGARTMIGHVGELHRRPAQVTAAVRLWLRTVREIRRRKLRSDISVKLTQIGLCISERRCARNLEAIAAAAAKARVFVWIDMESSAYTERTVQLYLGVFRRHRNVAVALQANLRRSRQDAMRICRAGGKIRLVKGAYREPPAIAYQGPAAVRRSYGRLLALLFRDCPLFAVATHDSVLVERALRSPPRPGVQFQVLLGIRQDLRDLLLRRGRTVGVYVPFGKAWLPYIIRRVRENKRDLLLVARSAAGELLGRFSGRAGQSVRREPCPNRPRGGCEFSSNARTAGTRRIPRRRGRGGNWVLEVRFCFRDGSPLPMHYYSGSCINAFTREARTVTALSSLPG